MVFLWRQCRTGRPGTFDIESGADYPYLRCDCCATFLRKREQVALEIARAAVPELSQKEIVPLDMPMTHDAAVLEKARAQAVETIINYLKQGSGVAF